MGEEPEGSGVSDGGLTGSGGAHEFRSARSPSGAFPPEAGTASTADPTIRVDSPRGVDAVRVGVAGFGGGRPAGSAQQRSPRGGRGSVGIESSNRLRLDRSLSPGRRRCRRPAAARDRCGAMTRSACRSRRRSGQPRRPGHVRRPGRVRARDQAEFESELGRVDVRPGRGRLAARSGDDPLGLSNVAKPKPSSTSSSVWGDDPLGLSKSSATTPAADQASRTSQPRRSAEEEQPAEQRTRIGVRG